MDFYARRPKELTEEEARLRFLKKARNTRLLAACFALAITLILVCGLYRMEFHYANTPEGRLAAVADYVVGDAEDWDAKIPYDAGVRVSAYLKDGRELYLYYGTNTEDNVRGVLKLQRGLNGKYRPCWASLSPYPYSAGAFVYRLAEGKILLAGENCHEIRSVRLEFRPSDGISEPQYQDYPLPKGDFLIFLDLSEQLEETEYGWRTVQVAGFLDAEGEDITENYLLPQVRQNWGGSVSSMEPGKVYFFMALTAGVGFLFIHYFLRRD